jgi:hypothetical protein
MAWLKRHFSEFFQFLKLGNLDSWLLRCVLIAGLLIPWATGIGVKLYLDSRGEPTWDLSYFLYPAIMALELWATFWFALPSLLLAWFGSKLFSPADPWFASLAPWERRMIILSSGVTGSVASVHVFLDVFWNFHPINFLLPFFAVAAYGRYYLAGLVLALLAALASARFRARQQ